MFTRERRLTPRFRRPSNGWEVCRESLTGVLLHAARVQTRDGRLRLDARLCLADDVNHVVVGGDARLRHPSVMASAFLPSGARPIAERRLPTVRVGAERLGVA